MAAKRSKESGEKESSEVVKVEPRQTVTPIEEMERWFEEFFHRPFFAPAWMPQMRFPELMGEIAPAVDIFEDGSDLVVKAEIPGVTKEDIEVTVARDAISIAGQKRAEERVEKKDYHRLERSSGSFRRTLRIPVEVQADKARAIFRDGVLEVRIPKSEAARARSKKVTVE